MKTYNERTQATREKIKSYKLKAKSRRKKILLSTVVSLCSCLIIALNLVMFVPYTTYPNGYIDLSKYKNSEYYDVIKEISYIQYGDRVNPVYKNNFQRLAESAKNLFDGKANDAAGSAGAVDDGVMAPGVAGGADSSSPGGGQHYEETTDNQVAGVIEGDLIKRTDKFIYYLAVQYYFNNPPTLRVYPIEGAQTECVAEFIVKPQAGYVYNGNNEMYLSEDGTTVTLILPTTCEWHEYGKYRYDKEYTEVINIDVSDYTNIKETGRYRVSGYCVSSRLVDGELLLVTNFTVPRNVDFDDEEQFMPATGTFGNMECIPATDIHCPQKSENARFTVVCSMNVQTLEETGSEAFLSYSQNVYVSENNIYLTNGYTNYSELPLDTSHRLRGDDYHYLYEDKTEISRVEYGGKLEYKGSFTVDGRVKDRFCMDEKDGVLRVVTSLSRSEYVHSGNYYNRYLTFGASLYCVDIQTYKTVGKLENFAPEKDSVQSVRFDGDKVYVCTAIVIIVTDPVFAIDISDYNNIHFVDTGEISGYSVALRKFYGDTLLGIGYGERVGWRNNLKIELYKETENSVESAAMFNYIDEGYEYNGHYYPYANMGFSEEYKSYFIDAERGLIGIGLTVEADDYSGNEHTSIVTNRYIVLQYDGENLNLVLDIELSHEISRMYYFYNVARAVYIDGSFYVFTEGGLTVAEL